MRSASSSSCGPGLICLADVEAREVEWLWEPFIPVGMLSMLSGDPGTGKSFIALSIAAELSRGKLRDGRIVEPASTLYLSVENPLPESVRPRFDALGGNAARFYSVTEAITLADIGALSEAIARSHARLVIVDPIQSYFGAGVDLHRSNETRPVMDGLSRLAESHGLAILLLRHLSKQSGGKAIHRGLGSIDLTGAVRSEMLAGSLPDDADTRAMVHIKSNVGRMGHTLGYTIDGDGRFAWTGESTVTADDLLAAPAGPSESKLDEACQWLTGLLMSGMRREEEIQSLAKAEGIAKATLRRAKAALNVRSSKDRLSGPWMWSLPEDDHATPEDAQEKCVSTFAKVEHLRRVEAPNHNATAEGGDAEFDYEEGSNHIAASGS